MPIPSANTTSPSPARQEPNEPKPSLTCPHCGACTETSICEYCTAPKRCRTRSTSATANDESKKDVRRHCKSDQCNPRPQRSLLLNSRREDDAWVDLSSERLPNSRLGALYPGSRFTGVQRSGTTSYEVAVDIQVVKKKGERKSSKRIRDLNSSHASMLILKNIRLAVICTLKDLQPSFRS